MGRIGTVAAGPVRPSAVPPVNQEEGEWTVVKPRRVRRKKDVTTVRENKREERATVMPIPSINVPKPIGARKEIRRAQGQAARTTILPRTPRASAVTVTLSGAAKTSYAEVLEQARNKISLRELGVERVEMRKAATGAIIIRVPGDKEKDKLPSWRRSWRAC
jgi:hypothetical protein